MLNHCGFVSPYDEAVTIVLQHDFMHLSFFKDDFREFVDVLVVALRGMEKGESPMIHAHPVMLKNFVLGVAQARDPVSAIIRFQKVMSTLKVIISRCLEFDIGNVVLVY